MKQLSKVTEEDKEADVAVSPSPGLSLSVIHGEEADDLSPRRFFHENIWKENMILMNLPPLQHQHAGGRGGERGQAGPFSI